MLSVSVSVCLRVCMDACVSLCVWMLTKVEQIATAAHRDL